jgi:cell wall assembly regulator SMI1
MGETMQTATDLTALFTRIDQVLERLTGEPVSEILNPPANEAAVTSAEAVLGLRLPEDVRQAYLWHDGANVSTGVKWETTWRYPRLIPADFHWSSLSEMLVYWQLHRDMEAKDRADPSGMMNNRNDDGISAGDPCRQFPFEAMWIPVGMDITGMIAHVDLHPSPWGAVGQLVAHDYDGHRVIAASFSACLSEVVDALEAGRYLRDVHGDWISARTADSPRRLADLR